MTSVFQKVGNEAVLRSPDGTDKKAERRFAFDHVYDHTSEQLQVYKDVAAPMLTKAFAGFNGTIFAFVSSFLYYLFQQQLLT